MSSAPATPTVLESSGARPFPSLLDWPVALPADRPLMSSAPIMSTIPKSSGARPFLSLLDRLAVLPAARPLMLDLFLLDGEVAPLIVNEPEWMKC